MKTTEKTLSEIGIAILLFFIIACAISAAWKRNKNVRQAAIEEMQVEEINSYHRSQGREIQLY